MQHSTEKPFSCPECPKTFKLKRALTVHIAQHANQNKSFKCNFCDRKFASSTNFYTHRKNIHPIELQEMKAREQEDKRKRRIEAGIEEEKRQNLCNSSDEIMVEISEFVDQASDSDHVLDDLMPSVTMVRDIIIDTRSGMVDSECQIDRNY